MQVRNTHFANLLAQARVGDVNVRDLNKLNSDTLCISSEQAQRKAHKDAIWISPYKETVVKRNKDCFQKLATEKNYYYRYIILFIAL